eukprot:1136164-Pelagomonas_calceolata.AAC.3
MFVFAAEAFTRSKMYTVALTNLFPLAAAAHARARTHTHTHTYTADMLTYVRMRKHPVPFETPWKG